MERQKVFTSEFVGCLDNLDASEITGWVFAEATPDEPVRFSVLIDGQPLGSHYANLPRTDISVAPLARSDVGFRVPLPARCRDGGEHSIEFFSISGQPLALWNSAQGVVASRWLLPSKPNGWLPAREIIAGIDAISEAGISGWAYSDSDQATDTATALEILIDGQSVAHVSCNRKRTVVNGGSQRGAAAGFHAKIPERYFDGKEHRISLRSLSGGVVKMADGEQWRSPSFTVRLGASTVGYVDGLSDGAIRGWLVRRDARTQHMAGGQEVLVTMNGQPLARLYANHLRMDVAKSVGCDPHCGFAFVPPTDALAGRTIELRFKALPDGTELQGSPYRAALPELDTERRIRDIGREVDAIFQQLWQLRTAVKHLLPTDRYSIHNYHQWAQHYFARLKAAHVPPPLPEAVVEPPLVSIVCPVYRPRLQDFIAAIESVIAQTYSRWELILVDDGSASSELTECLRRYAARDSRIATISRSSNGGISTATNEALKQARGTYVAFFDHDDLLVERALELMVNAALRTGAKLLYSDEDKIDGNGTLSEVNLKPDWNYRLLLAQNYVCHLLLVDRALLHKVGLLRSKYDGAQDHDLMLRLSEIVEPAQIHHVPEVLYHWRKSQHSTATAPSVKPYAIAAGVRAVADHLKRRGLSAKVRAPREAACYELEWNLSREPRVTVIVPYREQIGMTRQCLTALRSITQYKNFEVILIDNWSTSDEAQAFASEVRSLKNVKRLRIEETFNFSRLNNLAVAGARGEFVVFMNNDVVVGSPNWLTELVGEAMSDPKIAAVGCKLLYPSGFVQHGGVILGVGGVADHAHRGVAADGAGYMARAICAQDLSAVTGACVLCRRSAFDEVGGFDEVDLRVAFNDIDLCLKLRRAGYRIVWTPQVVATHHESLTRGDDLAPDHQTRFFHENQVMETRWGEALAADPFYNKNFSRRGGHFSDLRDPLG